MSTIPSPTTTNADRMPFGAMASGLRGAVERFKGTSPLSDPVAAAIPLFEALNWAVALDDRVREDWAPDGVDRQPGWDWVIRLSNVTDAEAVRGIRFIRNRVHHQWADALRIAKGQSRYPARGFDWVWASADELPPPKGRFDELGHAGYQRLLKGRPADFTLATLAETYEFMDRLLEPFGPPPHWRPRGHQPR
jgi:hypothetical protein